MAFLAPKGQDRLLRRKPVSQLPQAIPTAARMVGREAVPFPAGTLSSGKSSMYLTSDIHVDAWGGFAFANLHFYPSREELSQPVTGSSLTG